MTDSRPETSVVIVTYNSIDEITTCLERLQSATRTEVIVVDNDSSDGTPSMLEELAGRGLIDVLILSPTNDGFAKAVNTGMKASSGADVFFLNPDAEIEGSELNKLRDLARADPSIGIIAPLVLSGPTVAVMAAGQQPRLWPMFTHYAGIARLLPHVKKLRGRHLYMTYHSQTEQDVEWVSGCALYITEDAREKVGLLSERWFMYGEDIDFAHRVTLAGFRIVVTPDVVAKHAIGSSVNKAGGTVSTMWAENTYDYYVQAFHPGALRRSAWRIVFSVGLLSRALVFRARGARSGALREEFNAKALRFEAFARSVWKPRSRLKESPR